MNYPGVPKVITCILIRWRQEGQSQRRRCHDGSKVIDRKRKEGKERWVGEAKRERKRNI